VRRRPGPGIGGAPRVAPPRSVKTPPPPSCSAPVVASYALGCSAATARAAQRRLKLEEGRVGDVEQEMGKL
jgi:hypothetical protein